MGKAWEQAWEAKDQNMIWATWSKIAEQQLVRALEPEYDMEIVTAMLGRHRIPVAIFQKDSGPKIKVGRAAGIDVQTENNTVQLRHGVRQLRRLDE